MGVEAEDLQRVLQAFQRWDADQMSLVAPQVEAVARRWQALLREASLIELKPGQILFYAGHLPCGTFVLLSGSVRLCRDEEGKDVAGEMLTHAPFGLDLMALGQPYPLTARVVTAARVLFLPKVPSDTQLLGRPGQCGMA